MKKLIIILLLTPFFLNVLAPPLIFNSQNTTSNFQYRILYLQKLKKIKLDYLKALERKRLQDDISIAESGKNPLIVNSIDCIGLFQFGKAARKSTGHNHINPSDIIKDPVSGKKYLRDITIWPIADQYKAMDSLMNINETKLIYEIETYSGTTISGVLITKSGIICAAHLAGYGNVKRFFKTNGQKNSKDLNGTSILTYMNRFKGYAI